MPCRKLFSFCHCGGELWIVVEVRVGVIVCPDCGHRTLVCGQSTHPLLEERTQEPRTEPLRAEKSEPFSQN
jgi:hypothetical protein